MAAGRTECRPGKCVKGMMTVLSAEVHGLLDAGRRKLSLVDCLSFAVMREMGIREVFVFDQHFAEQGFRCHPETA